MPSTSQKEPCHEDHLPPKTASGKRNEKISLKKAFIEKASKKFLGGWEGGGRNAPEEASFTVFLNLAEKMPAQRLLNSAH